MRTRITSPGAPSSASRASGSGSSTKPSPIPHRTPSRAIESTVASPLMTVNAIAACATPFKADVKRFASQMPAPAGQTFAVVADDPRTPPVDVPCLDGSTPIDTRALGGDGARSLLVSGGYRLKCSRPHPLLAALPDRDRPVKVIVPADGGRVIRRGWSIHVFPTLRTCSYFQFRCTSDKAAWFP